MRVAFLSPPSYFDTSPTEFLSVAPQGTAVAQSFIPIELPQRTMSTLPLEAIRGAVPALEGAARTFAQAGADAVGQFGFPYSLAHGGDAVAVQRRLSAVAGVPVVMMGAALLEALAALGARRIAVAAGYYTDPAWREMTQVAFAAHGLEVASLEDWVSQGVLDSVAASDALAWNPDSPEGVRAAQRAAVAAARRTPGADAVAVMGGGLRLLGQAAAMEQEAGLPVVSGDVALAWGLLRALRQQPRPGRWGRLLDGLSRPTS
jgi:arylmalonate decarboxylase